MKAAKHHPYTETGKSMIWQDIEQIHMEEPLVHNITNYVIMNTTANALLAIGASPVMAHAIEEVEEMVSIARALVINIGTLSSPWVEAMFKAGKAAKQWKIPVILDPVGCGATQYRIAVAQQLMREISPTIIRGNASEIRALLGVQTRTKGVDSLHLPVEVADEARALAHTTGCTVSVSGSVDFIVDANSEAFISNGHPIMARVTGMGCTASAITGAFAAVNASPFQAAAHAMAVMGIAGEIAADHSNGPGSFQVKFLDTLRLLTEADIVKHLRMNDHA